MSDTKESVLFDWRAHLPVHPAADLFPLMSEPELKELADDIRKNGLKSNIILWCDKDGGRDYLLDGRNRLDALALIGWLLPPRKHKYGWYTVFQISRDSGIKPTGGGPRWAAITKHCSSDPYAIALSYNVHRRHLSSEQKRDLIEKILKATPEQSNRSIAKQVKADDKTVASVRSDLVATAEIPRLEKTVGADGKARKQPSKKSESLPAKVKVNGSDVKTDSFSPAAQEQIAKALRPADDADWQEPESQSAPSKVNDLHRYVCRYTGDIDGRFSEFLKENPKLPNEARECLHEILMLAANRLMEVAQQVDGRSVEAVEAAA